MGALREIQGGPNQVMHCNCVMLEDVIQHRQVQGDAHWEEQLNYSHTLMASELIVASQENNTDFAVDNLMKMSAAIKEKSTLLRCINMGNRRLCRKKYH